MCVWLWPKTKLRTIWLFGKFKGKNSVFHVVGNSSSFLKWHPAKTPKPAVWNQGANLNLMMKGRHNFRRNRYSSMSAVFKFKCIADTTNLFKMQNLKSSNPHIMQTCRCFKYVCNLIHALPGMADGARKRSQGGTGRESIWSGALISMLEATTSREQMIAVTSTVSCIMV